MIAVSAGHYPEKPGACFGDFCEHGEAVLWAQNIVERLGHMGFYVPAGILEKKIEFINERKPTIALEIHFNSFKIWKDANRDGLITDDELMHSGKGCETLYYPNSQRGGYLADAIQKSLAPTLFKDRGIKPGWYRMNPKNGPDFFLAKTKCPSVIVEPDFIHQKEWIQGKRDIACEMIANTLLQVEGELRGR